jgi:hypothetical protein
LSLAGRDKPGDDVKATANLCATWYQTAGSGTLTAVQASRTARARVSRSLPCHWSAAFTVDRAKSAMVAAEDNLPFVQAAYQTLIGAS